MADRDGPRAPDIADLLGLEGPKLVTSGHPDWPQMAREHLCTGGIVAIPTETVYGLAATLDTPLGVERLFELKKRSFEKAIAWQVADLEEARKAGFFFSEGALNLAKRYWPGPLTLVLPRPSSCPAWFSPRSQTVALRIPDHPMALTLLHAFASPLAVTSANASGKPECLDAKAVLWAFADCPYLLVVDGGQVPGGRPSTVVDATGTEPVILRKGPITLPNIREVWRGQ